MIKRSKVKVTRSINAVTENQAHLPNGRPTNFISSKSQVSDGPLPLSMTLSDLDVTGPRMLVPRTVGLSAPTFGNRSYVHTV